MTQQVSVKEPTAEQIAEQKIYSQFGVSDSEYELIKSLWDVCRTTLKSAYSA